MNARDEFLAEWRTFWKKNEADPELVFQPYPGLRSFSPAESDLFFGRERQIGELLSRLAARGVTFVLGGSGSGKSSLVRAGVMPRLATAPVQPAAGAWYAVEFRPGESPSAQLLTAIDQQIITPVLTFDSDPAETLIAHRLAALSGAFKVQFESKDLERARQICRERLRELLCLGGVFCFENVARLANEQLPVLDELLSSGARNAPPNLFILVDQFEELFGEKVAASDRAALIEFLARTSRDRPQRLYLVVTMRSEELHKCSEFEGLAAAINASLYLVDLIRGADLTDALEGPARRVLKNWGFDRVEPFTGDALALLQAAYEDSTGTGMSADRLPLMQHFMTLVWRRAVDRWLDNAGSGRFCIGVSDIQAIEGWNDRDGLLRGSLTFHADSLLKAAVGKMAKEAGFAADQAESLLRAAFCTLASVDDRDNPKRSFATLDDMLEVSGVAERERMSAAGSSAALAALRVGLGVFQRAGLIGIISENGNEKYNVNHEAFIRCWRTYASWVRWARQCEHSLTEVDEKLHEARPFTRKFDIVDFIFARRLQWAALTVTDDTSRLLEDVLGADSTFSRRWAREALGRVALRGNKLAEGLS